MPHPVEPLEPRTLFAAAPPRFDHIVVVVEENHSYNQVLLKNNALGHPENADPYIQWLARHGASFTNFQAEAHPSLPNYIAMFSGSTQGVRDDTIPSSMLTAPSLGGRLIKAGISFSGYAEDLPYAGFTGESSGGYVRRHVPWSVFADVPASANRPFSAFPTDFRRLKKVNFVIPSNAHNMHDGTVRAADDWIRDNLDGYIQWAPTHNSLLVVTWDEGPDNASDNHVATVFYGAHVKAGQYSQTLNHYNLLRSIEDMYAITPLGASAGKKVSNLADVFA